MEIALAQLNPIVGDLKGNGEKILSVIKKCEEQGADLIIFPELSLQGYPPEDLLLLQSFLQASKEKVLEIASQTQTATVLMGCIREGESQGEKPLFNSVAVMQGGKLLGYQDKTLLPTYDVFDERRYFSPALQSKIWEINSQKVLITICEDIWSLSEEVPYSTYREDFLTSFSQEKIDLIVNVSASPYHFKKPAIRKKVFQNVVQLLKAPLVFCNQVGGNDSLIFDGHSEWMDASGKTLYLAPGFEEGFFFPSRDPSSEQKEDLENLEEALVLALRDYFQKQNFKKAILGLSGGVDSALVAYLAQKALGNENVEGLLLPSRFTSKASIDDALELAANLGIQTKTIGIEPLYTSYLETLSPYFEGRQPDVTEENLQARIRGMLLMAFSNKFGFLVLSTGNKSEMALGYSTLYGDLCGGLAVISDVPKTMVYQLCRKINAKKQVIPENILTRPPSAELREDQKDSDTLPPYEVIDPILEAYVERHASAEEILQETGFSEEIVWEVIKKIHQNEYKRRQAPPGLRVTEKAFSKGRVFPIVQKWRN